MKKPKKPSQELAQAQVQRQDLRLFAVLASPEEDFLRQSAELEADPLFARLCAPGPDGSAPVLRRRLPGASYAFALACVLLMPWCEAWRRSRMGALSDLGITGQAP